MRRRLLLWLLVGFTLSTIVAALAVYGLAREEARAILDFQLEQMAIAFPRTGFGPVSAPPADLLGMVDRVVVQIWDRGGTQVYLSRSGSPPPESRGLGFSTVTAADGQWRIYSALHGDNVVQVSQPTSVRERLAARMALRTMLPILALLPILSALVWVTVGHGLKPLNDVASALRTRSAEALDPLPADGLPREVRPPVEALNDLLARLRRSIDAQRSFIGDAAHELRTPLTAVSLQAQIAERAATQSERTAAFARLKSGVERATRLVEQLLALARSEPDAAQQPFAPVDLAEVARHVVAERAPIAYARRVDVEFAERGHAVIMGDAEALHVMLGNLVDNAIHYAPARGTVQVEVGRQGDAAYCAIEDTGPGIAPAERERVFDRFYRGNVAAATGSGLGLAIVRKVAERHAASVALDAGAGGRGLKVSVRFPASAAVGAVAVRAAPAPIAASERT